MYMKYLFGALALVLLGAGCAGTSTQDGATDLIQDSAFVGVDGSLTEAAFDQVAELFLADVDETPHDAFAEWLEAHADQVPTTDTFGHAIDLQLREDGIVLISAGADGEVGTPDDYRKFYPLSQ